MQSIPAMNPLSPWEPGLTALFLYGLMILILIALLLFLASWLGETKISAEKKGPMNAVSFPPVRQGFLIRSPFIWWRFSF